MVSLVRLAHSALSAPQDQRARHDAAERSRAPTSGPNDFIWSGLSGVAFDRISGYLFVTNQYAICMVNPQGQHFCSHFLLLLLLSSLPPSPPSSLVSASGEVTVLAGLPLESGFVDGPGSKARFGSLTAIAIEYEDERVAADRLRVWLREGGEREGTDDGKENGPLWSWPPGLVELVSSYGCEQQATSLLLADYDNNRIRRVTLPSLNYST